MAHSETLHRRALSIHERRFGPVAAPLIADIRFLFDLYDQGCRIADAEQVLARLERIFKAHTDEPRANFYLERYRGVIARRNGNLELATRSMLRAVAELEAEPSPSSGIALRSTTYSLLAKMARDSGHYADSLRFTQLDPAVDSKRMDTSDALRLHHAYDAVASLLLANHDRAYQINAARAGAELFPTKMPALEACATDSSSELGGWLFRGERAYDQLADCADAAIPQLAPDAIMHALMRVESGHVVAAEVAGTGVDPTTLACAARQVLGTSVLGPHDFNFVEVLFHSQGGG